MYTECRGNFYYNYISKIVYEALDSNVNYI